MVRSNKKDRKWILVKRGLIVEKTGKYRPPFWTRLKLRVCNGLRYIPEKQYFFDFEK